jgi:cysteine-rich repeat protein
MKTGLAAILFLAACTSSNGSGGVCGDGVVDSGEQCDDGNTVSGDGCSATCTIEQAPQPVCGNGVVEGTEQCDDGNTTSGDGCSSTCKHEYTTQVTWSFKSTQTTGTLNCPTGYDTAAVYSQEVDGSGNPIGQPTIDLFTCSDGQGMTSPLSSGVYQTWLAVTNQAGTMTWGQSVDALVDLSASNATYAADLYIDGGYFAWKWMLIGAMSNNTLSCGQAGADAADMSSTLTSGGQAIVDTFSCTDGQGISAAIPAGNYTVSLTALDTNMAALGQPVNLTDKTINIKNVVTDLGTVSVPIDGK